jgi:hypothetical protein
VIRSCHRNLLPPPFLDERSDEEEKAEEAAGGGDRPDFSAWKVAIKNLNK